MSLKIETIWLNWGAYLSAKRFEFGKLEKLRGRIRNENITFKRKKSKVPRHKMWL